MKDIKDYLHFYLGCEVEHNCNSEPESYIIGNKIVRKVSKIDITFCPELIEDFKWFKPKLILRLLDSMSETDALYLARLVAVNNEFISPKIHRNRHGDLIVVWMTDEFNCTGERAWSAEQFIFLLKCGYDLFGLIESGLAIDKTTIKQ